MVGYIVNYVLIWIVRDCVMMLDVVGKFDFIDLID